MSRLTQPHTGDSQACASAAKERIELLESEAETAAAEAQAAAEAAEQALAAAKEAAAVELAAAQAAAAEALAAAAEQAAADAHKLQAELDAVKVRLECGGEALVHAPARWPATDSECFDAECVDTPHTHVHARHRWLPRRR